MSSNGEDIIRETFEKLGDAIGVQMQMPDAMITNLGAVLQAQIDLLAELQSTGRLVPAGGMALTAEQVEDVRTVLGKATTEYGAMELTAAWARLRALFPATEPAEDSVGDPLQAWKEFLKPKPIGWYSTMTREFATEHFGFPEVTGLLECTHTASDGGTWGWCGGDWELLVYPPAPAVPAEEETKAEAESDLDMHPDAVYGREYVEQAKVRRIARAVKECDTPSSSPVVPAPTETEFERGVRAGINEYRLYFLDENNEGAIYQEVPVAELDRAAESAFALAVALDNTKRADTPAPTETGPWQTWEEVPNDTPFWSRDKRETNSWWWIKRSTEHRKELRQADSCGETVHLGPTSFMNEFAPFVAAEEG